MFLRSLVQLLPWDIFPLVQVKGNGDDKDFDDRKDEAEVDLELEGLDEEDSDESANNSVYSTSYNTHNLGLVHGVCPHPAC